MKQPLISITTGYSNSAFAIAIQLFTFWRCFQILVLILFTPIFIGAQSLGLSQTVSNPNPDSDEAFEFIISVSCNSTTANCLNTIVSGFLPEELEFINFSDPLPIGVASATYDIATRYYEVTFDEAAGGALAQGSTIQFSIQAMFPGGSVSGISATNTVNATSTNAVNASVSTTVNLGSGGWQTAPGTFPAWKGGDTEQLQGGYQYWQVRIGNIGSSDIDNYQVFDATPALVTLDQIRTPEIPNLSHPGSVYYKRSDDAVNWYLWTNFNVSSRQTLNVSGLGLPPGIEVTETRWDFGTIPASPLWNTVRYADGFRTDIILYGTVDNPLADGITYTNCADYSGSTLSTPVTDQACQSTTINSAIAIDAADGHLDFADKDYNYITQANIGDTIKANWNFYSPPEMINDIYGGVMSIVLPIGMYYIPGTLEEEWTCVHFDGQSPVIETSTATDGRQIVRFVYDASLANEFIIEAVGDWDGCGFYFDVVVGNSTPEGWIRGYYYMNATGSTHADCGNTDTQNFLNGYATTFCYEEYEDIQIFRAPGSAGVRAEKEVIGTLDGSYSQYPATGTTVPGGLSDYRITITNPNTTPIDSITIIDILPFSGDTDILDETTPRFSDWRPNLAAPITAPAGVTVYYTTVNNPCRDELAGTNPTPFPSGCTTPSWSSVPPFDITDVTALKFDLYGITLNQNDDVVIDFEMRAPVNAPTSNEVAWNSFAYVARNATSGAFLLPTEAIKVGIETIPGTVPIGGDFVWNDLNGNGLQDVGEPGIDGVRVALIEDTNGNGTLGGGDTEYTWTITANGGQYIFSDFPTGNYFIQFSNFPAGYVVTHANVGANEGLDSDGPTTDLVTFNNTTDTRDIDFGLYNGVLPPLWQCNSALLTNNEFESGTTDWVNWGNFSQTNDAYVNARAALVNGGEGGFGQVISVSPGQTYQLSFYAKKTGSEAANGGINVKDVNDVTIYSMGREVFENVYEYHSVTLTIPANGDHIEVWGYKNAGSGAAYFDAFCLELINEVCVGDDSSCSKPVTQLDNVQVASVRGVNNSPSLAYAVPSGDYSRALVVTLSAERDHTCTGDGEGDNWMGDVPIGGSAPTVTFGGVSMVYEGMYWQYGGSTSTSTTTAQLSSEVYVYSLQAIDFPAGGAGTISVSGAYRASCDGDETILMASTFTNVASVDKLNGVGGQNGTAGTFFSTTNAMTAGGGQPAYSNVTDNMMLAVSPSSSESGDLLPGGGYTELIQQAESNFNGTFNPSGSISVFSENDGYMTMWQSITNQSGNVTSSVTYSGPNNPSILGVVPVRLTSIGCEICDNGIDDDSDGLIDCSDAADCNGELACSESDGDSVCQNYDIDDDNDGIRDIDESACNGNQQVLLMWSHNTPADTRNAEIYQSSWIASATQENYGSGLGAYLDATLVKMTGVDQSDLEGAVLDNDYLEYSLTTQPNINALYLYQFGKTKHGVATGAISANYGYDFSIMVSDNGFSTSTLISDIFNVDHNINPSWTSLFQESDDNFFYLEPATTYTFRVYFYNKTTNAATEAFYDDFNIIAELCDIELDTDGDGNVNSLDLDSDNDGISDVHESGHQEIDSDQDGVIDGASANSGINGLFDPLETTADNGNINYTLSDSESSPDGRYDPYELDSDGDGCFDTEEAYIPDADNNGVAGTGSPTTGTTGLVNGMTYLQPPVNFWQDPLRGICLPELCDDGIDNDLDGYFDCDDCSDCFNSALCLDSDGDGISNNCDIDDDNDGITDAIECYGEAALISTLWLNDTNNDLNRVDDINGTPSMTTIGNMGVTFGDIAMSPDGTLYGTDYNSLNIYSINTSTAITTLVGTLPLGTFPIGGNALTFDENGMGYVGDLLESAIYVFDPLNPAGATIWHDFGSGGPSGDFLFINNTAYIAWLESGVYSLRRVTLNSMNDYVSDVTLGVLPEFTYGLAADALGNVYAIADNQLFLIVIPPSPLGGGMGAINNTPISGTLTTGQYYGLTSNVESLLGLTCDIDGDGYVNSIDLDSDNDGLTDLLEIGHGASDTNNDGRIDGASANSGSNGFFNSLETAVDNGIITYTLSESEEAGNEDGLLDPYDWDSDGDGCFDTAEAQIPDADEDGFSGTGIPSVTSTGLVVGNPYGPPINYRWQDPSINECNLCNTAIINPHVMYFGPTKR